MYAEVMDGSCPNCDIILAIVSYPITTEAAGYRDEVVELLSNRFLMTAANEISRRATERMKDKPGSDFGKPGDVSGILRLPHR